MSVISMKQLLEAGVHFGHQTRRWNPKMAPYIYTERNGIYIIDLQKSVVKVDEAYKAVADIAAEGGDWNISFNLAFNLEIRCKKREKKRPLKTLSRFVRPRLPVC